MSRARRCPELRSADCVRGQSAQWTSLEANDLIRLYAGV